MRAVLPYLTAAVVLLCAYYISEVYKTKYEIYQTGHLASMEEGFQDKQDHTMYSWIDNPSLIYDDFYAGVYDQLSHQAERSVAKVAVLESIWKKKDENVSSWAVLDAGCGTGWATHAFAKGGVGYIVGLDQSRPMLDYARDKTPLLMKIEKADADRIRWRNESLEKSTSCAAGEFTHIVCFYFTYYYLKDQEQFFRNCNFWAKPGGKLCVEVVNKYKFDPILESASPFAGFSLQKYSQERIRKSKVAFDKFDYEAEFQLSGDKAEFYETFRFKQGSVRRQKHVFVMPEIKRVIELARRAGWIYKGYQDLNPLGFEYGYMLCFEKN